MKKFAVRFFKRTGGGIFLLPLILLLFVSCEHAPTWNEPVKEFFDYYTNSAAIETYEIVQPHLVDKDGNICLSSDGDKYVLLYARNPKKYTLTSNWAANDPDAEGGVTIDQDSGDPTVFHLKFTQNFLKEHERGGDIGGTITQTETASSRVFEKESFKLNMRCNSAPQKPQDVVVMLSDNQNNDGTSFVLCFNLGEKSLFGQSGKHGDVRTISINGDSYTLGFGTDGSVSVSPKDGGKLVTEEPAGIVPNPAGSNLGFTYNAAKNSLYYLSGISKNNDTTFTIVLNDEAGLESRTAISSSGKTLGTPVLLNPETNELLSSGSGDINYIELKDGKGSLLISAPTATTNGESIDTQDLTTSYTISGGTSSSGSFTGNGKTISIESEGTYTIKIWSAKTGYLDSKTAEYKVCVRPKYTYKVKHLFQNIDNDDYSYNSSYPDQTYTIFKGQNTEAAAYSVTGFNDPTVTNAPLTEDNKEIEIKYDRKTYTLSYDPVVDGAVVPEEKTYRYGKSVLVDFTHVSRTGYNIRGWATTSSASDPTYTTSSPVKTIKMTEDKTLYAIWKAKQYNLTLDANDGVSNTQTKRVTYDANYGTFPTTSKTGYKFEGWYTDKTGGNVVLSTDKVTITQDMMLYAHWTACEYKVSFDLNYTGAGTAPSDITVTYDGTYSGLPPNPTRTGYTFKGWYPYKTYGTKVTSSTKVQITADQTLYAHWDLNYYEYNYTVQTNCKMNSLTATIGSSDVHDSENRKIANGASVKIQFEGNSEYGLSSVIVQKTDGSKNLSANDITFTEKGGTKVDVEFTMPDYPITITPIFKKAYKVKITPYSCTYSGITEYVKEKCKNKPVRIWIADKDGQGIFDGQYKEVTLDENAEYDGYILYPNSVSTLSSNALLCALTVYQVDNITGNHGFCYGTVSSSTTNLTMAILQPRT
ncbi:MAG: InlB B-repeat-containing protein, partial [Treponema sp.]|nr:InlB B-repeat-containing protein [Treponema sp.]